MTTDVGGGAIKSVVINGQDCTALIASIDVNESITTLGMSCEIRMVDGAGFRKKAKLDDGEHKIEFTIADRITNNDQKFAFKQSAISPSHREKEKADVYQISGLPNEFTDSMSTTIKDAEKKQKPSEIWKKHHQKYMEKSYTVKKELTVKTNDKEKINYWPTSDEPLHALDHDIKQFDSGTAVYNYQTASGYFLMDQKELLQASPIATLKYTQQNIGNRGSDPRFNIQTYEIETTGNKTALKRAGANSNKTVSVNAGSGSSKTITKGNNPTAKNIVVSLNPTIDSSYYKKRDPSGTNGHDSSKERVIKKDPNKTDEYKLGDRVIKIVVPAQSIYEAGKMVKLEFPNTGEGDDKDDLTGNWLIMSLRRTVSIVEADTKYITVMRLGNVEKAEAKDA